MNDRKKRDEILREALATISDTVRGVMELNDTAMAGLLITGLGIARDAIDEHEHSRKRIINLATYTEDPIERAIIVFVSRVADELRSKLVGRYIKNDAEYTEWSTNKEVLLKQLNREIQKGNYAEAMIRVALLWGIEDTPF